MVDERLKEKLKKLQALAERGVGGERTTAQKKLEKLLASNGITESELEEDEVKYYLFSYNGQHKKRLLMQIIYKVLGASSGVSIYHSKGTRNKIGTYCTTSQKIEIELDYEFYSGIFDEEVDTFLTAFIAKQNIYPEDVPVEHINVDNLTQEELETFRKKMAYENSIDKRTRSAMLEDKEGQNE